MSKAIKQRLKKYKKMNVHNETTEKRLNNSIVRLESFRKATEQKFNLESSRFFLNASTNKSIFELKKIASRQLQQHQDNLNFLNNFTE